MENSYPNKCQKIVVNLNNEPNNIQKELSKQISNTKSINPYAKYINQKASFIPVYVNKNVNLTKFIYK